MGRVDAALVTMLDRHVFVIPLRHFLAALAFPFREGGYAIGFFVLAGDD